MRITANHVTLVRLVLLPVPVAMLYGGTLAWQLGALGVYVLLGLTDALDGMLARRHGATPMGALLDPIADKIFLVAAFGPMAHLGMISTDLAAAVFVREFAVTVLRSIALEEGAQFRTSLAAKLKTTVQMAGAGLILLFHLFREGPGLVWLRILILTCGSLPLLISLARGRRPGWRAVSSLILFGGAAGSRFVLGPEGTNGLVMWVITALTLYTGAEYFWSLRTAVARRFRRAPVEAIRLVACALVLPIGLWPRIDIVGAPVWWIFGIFAAELAVGGVDNSLVQAGAPRGPWPDLVRTGIQAIAAVVVSVALDRGGSALVVHGAAAVALVVTIADFSARLARDGRRLDFESVIRARSPRSDA